MDRKRMKKLISILTVVALFSMSFASAFSVAAEGEPYTISADDVTKAILYDHTVGAEAPENVVGGNDYDVVPSRSEDGKIEVAITATDVKLHKNNANTPTDGYWVGFAVVAPEGAEAANINFGGDNYANEPVTDIDGNGTEGIAFYINAGELNPKTEATLTWFNEDSAISEEATFIINIDNVTLHTDYTFEEKIGKAIIDDKDNREREVYDENNYNVSYNNGVVDIDMTKLELHKNDEGNDGFWTGFAVEAPERAAFAKYTFGEETDTENVTDIDGDAGDKIGIAFYTDAANPKTAVKLQWFEGEEDGENNALSNPIELTINLDGVEYYKVDAENDVTEAILFDHSEEEPKTTLFSEGTYDVDPELSEGVINVAISAENVVKHENEAHTAGYWVGFAVVAPEGATKAKGIFGTPYEETVTDIDGNGTEGIAFYINAGDANPKTTATLQWLDENGETLSDVTTFEINLDNVTLDVIDYTPEIVKANIADYDEEREVYESYDLDTETTPGVVAISMSGLKEHTREPLAGDTAGEAEGYWTGFAVEVPTGATQFKYAFGADKETLVWEEGLSGFLHELEDIDGAEGEKLGVAFITDVNNTPKKYAMLQWFDNDDNAVTDVVEFEMNLDDVKLNWLKKEDVSEAVLDDIADEVETLYTSHSIDKQQADETITVKILTKDLEVHQNEDVDVSKRTGYWTGFAVNVPAEATHIKYTFDKESDVEWSSATTIPVEENVVDGKFSLYTNAGAVEPKLYAQLQWLKDGASLCAPTKFVIDISGVILADLPYITVDKVEKANIVEQANTSVQPYSTYAVSPAANEEGVIVVDIDMTDLKSHLSNGAGEGYWTGFSVVAPDNAATMRYAFAADKESLSMNKESVETGVATVDEVEKNGVAFYSNMADATPNKYARLQWFDVNGVALTNATDFEMDLSGVLLYVAPSPNSPRGGSSGSSNYCTVSFNSNGGSTVASAKVKKEGTVSVPGAPVKDGFVFDGWYTDKELTQKYDFSSVVTKSFTLYAKWTENKAATGLKFTDVKKDAWYYDVIKTAVEKGLMNGISETEFAPEFEVTRGMFVTILYRAAGEPEVAAMSDFTDVSADAYYAKAVAWASANKIVNGITDELFAPNANITREQMAVMLYRYKKAQNAETEITYTDKDEISDYALDAIAWANEAGIMTGNEDGSFAPMRNSSRAEAAAVFVRLFNL